MTCRELKWEYDRARSELSDKYELAIIAAAHREFPVGTTVKFKNGMRTTITGVVASHGTQSWEAGRVAIRNSKTNTLWSREAHELEVAK